MTKFTVQVRAIRLLTIELEVEADSEDEACFAAEQDMRRRNDWDESDPQDVRAETVEPVS